MRWFGKHVHEFKAQATDCRFAQGSAVTCVLTVCACGAFTSKTIFGHFTIEDFEKSPSAKDIAKQLGVKL